MKRRFLELSVIGMLGACAPRDKPPAAPSSPAVGVRVTHVSRDQLEVVYSLPQPLARLELRRESTNVREHWVPVDARLEHAGDHDVIVAPSPRTRFVVNLPVDENRPEKDYRNFYTFTDGGRLFYTGHLAATTWPGTITLIAGAGESVIARGSPPGLTATLPMLTEGTYVYFGSAKPIATDDFVGVIDPGLPASVRANLDQLVPPLFKLYGDGLGRPTSAAEKPLLFATYTPPTGPAWRLDGGVMPPRVVNFGFELPNGALSNSTRIEIDATIAHESAHLWNNDLYSSEAAWIQEGTADALAFRALRTLGAIDEATYLQRQSDALSLCIASLAEGEPFAKAARPNHYKELYFCGATIALLSEAAAKEPLITFLKEVYAGPNNHYDENRYFEVLGAKDAAAGAFVRKLVTDKLADPTHDLPGALTRVGIALEPEDSPGDYYNRLTAAYAIRAIVDPKCLENVSIRNEYASAVVVNAPTVCGEMEVGDRIEMLAGLKLRSNAADAWDAATAQCAKDGFVRTTRKDKPEAHLPCAKPARARPQYFLVKKAR